MQDWKHALCVWGLGFAVCVAVDVFFLGYIASRFYQQQLGHLLTIEAGSMKVNIPAALATWALLTAGILIFVLPQTTTQGVLSPMLKGGIYGLIVYGVYDLTNLATLRDWPFVVTVFDMLWGICVCALVSLWMHYVSRRCCRECSSSL